MPTVTPSLTLAEPQVSGPLAVFPILGPEPDLAYRTLARAIELGAIVKELDGGASVNDLLVDNLTDQPVLIYDGEEVLGAQQNRTFDVSALIGAGQRVELPVSCVEAGRWDHTRADDHFSPAPHAADPSLRRVKRAHANALAAEGATPRAQQSEVWDEVSDRLECLHVDSPSAAMHDAYKHKRSDLDELVRAVRPLDGQVGAVAEVSGKPVALDLVSRPDAFAELLPRLAQGYALEAFERDSADPDSDAAEMFLASALAAPRMPAPVPGIAHAFAVNAHALLGAGLEHASELVQLSAFPGDGDGRHARSAQRGAIARPAARRARRRNA